MYSAQYRSPNEFEGQRVLIVAAGNLVAQILAEVASVADAIWVTLQPPHFLPDEVDGRYLFEHATARYRAMQEGQPLPPATSLSDIVIVPAVRAARDQGILETVRPFARFTAMGVV